MQDRKTKQVIGIIHNTYLLRGGEDQVVDDEYNLLKNNGYTVELLLFKNPTGKVAQLFIYLISPFNVFSLIRCMRWLRKHRIDIIHIHNWLYAASPSIFWAAKWCRVPVVATLHNYRMICPSGTLINNGQPYYKSLQTGFSWQAVKDGVYRNSSLMTFVLAFTLWFNKMIGTWKIANRYIVLTQHSINVIINSHLKGLAGKLTIKPNFILKQEINPEIKRSDHFLFVGRLSEEKGITILLAAFKHSAHQLVIIGDGPLQERVNDYAANHNNVHYYGFQDKAFINSQLQQCTALVFPSIWYETFGLILIEAFASGNSVIASNIGSASLIIQNDYNGLHFDSGKVEDLKKQLDKWASFDDATKQQFRNQAFQSYLDFYTTEKNLEKLTAIYQDCLAAHE